MVSRASQHLCPRRGEEGPVPNLTLNPVHREPQRARAAGRDDCTDHACVPCLTPPCCLLHPLLLHCVHRYIIQVSVVWAVPSCKPAGASPGGSIPLESSRLASKQAAAGPTNIYMFDKETVELIPQGIEAATVVYDGVTITKPAEEGIPVPTIPVASSSSSSTGSSSSSSTSQQVAVAVPTIPIAQPVKRVQEETGPAEKPAAASQQQQAAAKQAVAQQGAGGGKAVGCGGERASSNCDTGAVLAAAKN